MGKHHYLGLYIPRWCVRWRRRFGRLVIDSDLGLVEKEFGFRPYITLLVVSTQRYTRTGSY